MRGNKNKRVVMLVLALVSLAVIGACAWQLWGPALMAPTQAKVTPKAPARSTAQQEKKQPEPPKSSEHKSAAQTPVRQVYSSSSTLGDLSRYRGQKIILEQQVRIAELEQRLKELGERKKPEIILPDLMPPKQPKGDAQPAVTTPAPKRGPVVVSVQGVSGALSATIRTSDGRTVTVKNGAAFGGGRLQVTRRGVFILRGGKPAAIPFE